MDAALGTVLRTRDRPRPPYPHGAVGPRPNAAAAVAEWAPALLAPLAAAAHVRHGVHRSEATAAAARLLDAAVIGAGVAGLVETLVSSRRTRRPPALAPLAVASAGVLGLIVERAEREAIAARERLERRASIIDRLAPRRWSRTTRIVIRV